MADRTSINQFLTLVQRVHAGTTGRSENDLSSKLALVLRDLDLHTVLDTGGVSGSPKRPDILAYASAQDADLILPAELVIEAKKPEEIEQFSSLAEAMVSDRYWYDKTYPYLCSNISCRGARTSRAIPENHASFCARLVRMGRGAYLRTAASCLRTACPT
jgi:hypothetical protein